MCCRSLQCYLVLSCSFILDVVIVNAQNLDILLGYKNRLKVYLRIYFLGFRNNCAGQSPIYTHKHSRCVISVSRDCRISWFYHIGIELQSDPFLSESEIIAYCWDEVESEKAHIVCVFLLKNDKRPKKLAKSWRFNYSIKCWLLIPWQIYEWISKL